MRLLVSSFTDRRYEETPTFIVEVISPSSVKRHRIEKGELDSHVLASFVAKSKYRKVLPWE